MNFEVLAVDSNVASILEHNIQQAFDSPEAAANALSSETISPVVVGTPVSSREAGPSDNAASEGLDPVYEPPPPSSSPQPPPPSPPSPPSPPTPTPTPASPAKAEDQTGLYVGIGVGAGAFILCIVLFCLCKKRSAADAADPKSAPLMTRGDAEQAADKGSPPDPSMATGKTPGQKSTQPRVSVYQQATDL